jgi:hypothetical protein
MCKQRAKGEMHPDGSVYINALRARASNRRQLHVIKCLLFSPGEHNDVAIEVRHASFVRLHFPNSAFQIDESRHGLNIVTSKHVDRMYGIVRENRQVSNLCRRFETPYAASLSVCSMS